MTGGTEKKEELELIIYKEESEIRCKNSGFMATDGQGDTWSISTSKFLVANEDNICISGRKEHDSVPLITIIDAESKNSRRQVKLL